MRFRLKYPAERRWFQTIIFHFSQPWRKQNKNGNKNGGRVGLSCSLGCLRLECSCSYYFSFLSPRSSIYNSLDLSDSICSPLPVILSKCLSCVVLIFLTLCWSDLMPFWTSELIPMTYPQNIQNLVSKISDISVIEYPEVYPWLVNLWNIILI